MDPSLLQGPHPSIGFLGTGWLRSFCSELLLSWQVRAGGFHPIPGPSVSICHGLPAAWHEDGEGGGTRGTWPKGKTLSYLSEKGEGA